MAKNNNTPDPQINCCPDCGGPFYPCPGCDPPFLQGAIYYDQARATAWDPDCLTSQPICCDSKINTFECLGSRSISQTTGVSLQSFELDLLYMLSKDSGTQPASADRWEGPYFLISGLILKRGWDEGTQPDYRIFRKITPHSYNGQPFPLENEDNHQNEHRVGISNNTFLSHVPLQDTGGFYKPGSNQAEENIYTMEKNSFGSAFTPSAEPDFQVTIWVDRLNQRLTQLPRPIDEFCGTTNNVKSCHFKGFQQKSAFTTTGVIDLETDSRRLYPGYCDPNMGWNGTTRSAVPPTGELRLPVSSSITSNLPVANKSRPSLTAYGSSEKNIQFVKEYLQTYITNDIRKLQGVDSFDAYVWTGRNAIWTPPT
jgi:hypothetical protein